MRIIRNDTNEPKTINNTMNSIFVGSTKDLQDLINPKRSFSKAIDNLNEQGIAVSRGEED
jgi:hypothetical protein